MDPSQLDNIVLALLFASDEPLSSRKIIASIGGADSDEVKQSIANIEKKLAEDYPSVMLEKVAGGYQLSTNPAYADYIARLYSNRRKQRLSKAGLETVAIIAYKQPITRADCESIRGVGCGGVITTLMERDLIRITGKAKVLGAPFLYGTTQEFLEYLGLNSLKDLPSMEELEALLERQAARVDEENEETESPLETAPEQMSDDAETTDELDEDATDEEAVTVASAATMESFPGDAPVKPDQDALAPDAIEEHVEDEPRLDGQTE